MEQEAPPSADFKLVFPRDDTEMILPVATTKRVIAENFGPEFTIEKDVTRLMSEMGTEFVLMISSVAHEFAEKDGLTTITARHIIAALVDLGFHEYVPELKEFIEQLRIETKRKRDEKTKKATLRGFGLSTEELHKQQAELFEAARARLVSEGGEVPESQNEVFGG